MPEQKMTRFTPAGARQLVAAGRQAMLSTLRADGSPYVSYVSHAVFADGSPLLFISKLAWHTRHLERDGRASLLVLGEKAQGDALMTSRVSLMGVFRPIGRAEGRGLWLAAHPEAEAYLDFADFGFWRMEVAEVHAVAGFGQIETFAGEAYRAASPSV